MRRLAAGFSILLLKRTLPRRDDLAGRGSGFRFAVSSWSGWVARFNVESEPARRLPVLVRRAVPRRPKSPAVAPEAPAERENAAAPLEWSKISILLADDSATNRLVAKHQLQTRLPG